MANQERGGYAPSEEPKEKELSVIEQILKAEAVVEDGKNLGMTLDQDLAVKIEAIFGYMKQYPEYHVWLIGFEGLKKKIEAVKSDKKIWTTRKKTGKELNEYVEKYFAPQMEVTYKTIRNDIREKK